MKARGTLPPKIHTHNVYVYKYVCKYICKCEYICVYVHTQYFIHNVHEILFSVYIKYKEIYLCVYISAYIYEALAFNHTQFRNIKDIKYNLVQKWDFNCIKKTIIFF